MRTAQELMTANPKMIASGDTLIDVVKLFLSVGITSSPVINPMGEILGILSELSLVKAYMLHTAKFHKNDKVGHHLNLLQPVRYISESAPLADVLREIIASPTNRLLVMNDKKKITGIISPKDFMRALLGEHNPSQSLKEKLQITEEKLKKSLEENSTMEKTLEVYQKVFHETPYMMHAMNSKGEIIMANKREHDVLGYENDELIGKSIFDLYAKNMQAQVSEGLKQVQKEGHHHLTHTSVVKKDGTMVNCDMASSSIVDQQGNFVSSLTVLRQLDMEEFLHSITKIVNDKDGPLAGLAARN